ncbi:hypothetical protein SAMN06265377_1811 [Flagellimonas pacifica]|uniref:Uncharacterized protein n=1 Tax=Flagellimonas pacifica TaxID=1247520 RepID=A0A285MS31_9FLAO|nr:hypothetical protein SAMN06265377_1811 [Allomuricauda parva]
MKNPTYHEDAYYVSFILVLSPAHLSLPKKKALKGSSAIKNMI